MGPSKNRGILKNSAKKGITQEQLSRNIKCLWKDRIQMETGGSHLDKDTTSIPRCLLLNRYSREAGYREKAACAPWRVPPPFLVGVSKGATLPICTRLCEAKCSVLYARPRCQKMLLRGQGHLKRQRPLLRGVEPQVWFQQQTAYMKAPVPRPTA